MKKFLCVSIVILMCVLNGCERAEMPTITYQQTPSGFLVANIMALNDSGLSGHATFRYDAAAEEVRVVIYIRNAVPGLHAAHLHTGRCEAVGPHWHPVEVPAGVSGVPIAQATRESPPVGIGEIGNIDVGESGVGTLAFSTPFWTLDDNPQSGILGKLILIHEASDTFLSIPHLPDHTPIHAQMHAMDAAHADTAEKSGPGAKIGCGVIAPLHELHHAPSEAASMIHH